MCYNEKMSSGNGYDRPEQRPRRTEETILSIYEEVKLSDCPYCGGVGLLEEEGGADWYVICMDCGSQTAPMEFKTPQARLEAAKKAANQWNHGKVIRMGMGE